MICSLPLHLASDCRKPGFWNTVKSFFSISRCEWLSFNASRKIIVACGGAVATSTVAADAIRELCKKNNIDADVEQMRIIEIASNLDGVDLVVTTMRIKPDFSTPYVNGMAFLTGINQEATEKKILDVLTKK